MIKRLLKHIFIKDTHKPVRFISIDDEGAMTYSQRKMPCQSETVTVTVYE